VSEFDDIMIRARAEMRARSQVPFGAYETRIVREGPRAYTVPTERALRLQAEIRRLTEEIVKVLTEEKLAAKSEKTVKGEQKTLWDHLDDD